DRGDVLGITFRDACRSVRHAMDDQLRQGGSVTMLYAILCYHSEAEVGSWSNAQDDAVMSKLAVVEQKLAKAGRLGPVARLRPTTAATTLRKDRDPPLVIDGP